MKSDLDAYEPKLNSHKEISLFRRTCCLHFHCSTLNMTAKFSEPLVNINQTVRSDILIKGNLQAQIQNKILQKKKSYLFRVSQASLLACTCLTLRESGNT